jgi:hypothetical protein
MKKVRIVTTAQLENIILGLDNNSAQFGGLVTFTEPKVTKKDRVTKEPHGFTSIKKLTRLSMIVNAKYENAVHNQLEREGKSKEDYVKGKNTMVIDKSMSNNNFSGFFKDRVVIEYYPQKYYSTKFIANGKLTDKAKLGDILPKYSKATNQGTEKEVQWRKLYVSNIRRININGKRYKVVNA